jgi:hypothetical protein
LTAVLNDAPPGSATDTEYLWMPDPLPNTYNLCAIGLSTQNDASPYLYTSYLQWDGPTSLAYYIGLKTTGWWGNVYFHPGTTDIRNVSDSKSSVFPNPFEHHLQLVLKTDNRQLELMITDVLGRNIFHSKGDSNTLNADLSHIGARLHAGTYIITVTSGQDMLLREQVVKY